MNRPPEIARWILSITNRKYNRENVLGDFNEFYVEVLETNGKKYANWWYRKQALKSIPKFINSSFYWGGVMFKNYLKIVFRNIVNQKMFSTINVLGLALGMAISMLAIIFITYELSYDRYHENADNIYRVTLSYDTPSGYKAHFARCHQTWINNLPDDLPEVKTLIRFQWTPSVNLKIGEKKIRSSKWYITDAQVFDVFSFKLLEGDPSTALVEPQSVVITEKIAEQFFRSTDPLGKSISLMNETTGSFIDYKITGVMENLPPNSHFQVDYLVSYPNEEARQGWAWIYILTKDGTDPDALESKLPDLLKKYEGEEALQYLTLYLQSLTDIHLYSHLDREIEQNGDIKNIYIFSTVALLALFIAGFNFLNLSTARSSRRVKEVGVRKVLGASKMELVKYFIWESVIFSFLAFLFAVIIIIIAFPYFQNLLGNTIPFEKVLSWTFLGGFFLTAVITGILSGLYPALVLSSFNPLNAFMKGNRNSSSGKQLNVTVRKILVVLQFTMSIVLIIFTLFSYNQFNFISNKKLGFNKDQILAIRNVSRIDQIKFQSFKNALRGYPGIKGVSACMDVPSRDILDQGFTVVEGIHSGDQSTVLAFQSVDRDFLKLMGMEIIAGENFNEENTDPGPGKILTVEEMQQFFNTKQYSYILNESAVKKLGFKTPDEAIGRKVEWHNSVFKNSGKIIGVVKDYNYASLRLQIRPLILISEPIWNLNYLVKISSKNMKPTLAAINETWNNMYPNSPIEYDFLDDLFAKLYRDEEKQGELYSVFSALAIFIAYLGLFGLVSYTTEQRKKEVGIRKVMGASIPGVVTLLGKEFTKLILTALLFAIPLGYYLVKQWLENFAYRIEITWDIFLWAAFITIFIAMVTVGYQTIKSALANPVEALKYE